MPENYCRFCVRVLPLSALITLLVCYCFHSTHVEAQAAPGGKVRELQEQRLATLRNLVTITSDHYKSGLASFGELASARRARDTAELELCSSAKERIAILERTVDDAKALEEQQSRLVANKLAPETSLLRAKAERLQQEILLEQARTE